MIPRLQSLKDSIQKLNSKTDSVVEQDEVISPRKSPRLVGKENNIPGAYTPGSLLRKSVGGKKKRVSFGEILSPEYFDKRLPPLVPVKLGESPAGTPAYKDRRRSDPLRSKALMSSAKKRVSLGIGLSSTAIAEEEEHHDDNVQTLLKFDDSLVSDPFEDSPNTKSKLPPPLMAEQIKENKSSTSKSRRRSSSLPTPLLIEVDTEEQKSTTPKSTPKPRRRSSSLQGRPVLRVRRSSTSTPARKLSIGASRKSKTPIHKQIEEKNPESPDADIPQPTRLPTPVRDEIHAGSCLKPVYNELPSALQEDIMKSKKLRATKKKVLKTPLKKEILSKPSLRRTLKRGLKTPIRQEIRKGLTF